MLLQDTLILQINKLFNMCPHTPDDSINFAKIMSVVFAKVICMQGMETDKKNRLTEKKEETFVFPWPSIAKYIHRVKLSKTNLYIRG